MHILLFLFVALTWSASFILMKRAGEVFGPITIAGLRVFGGAVILAAYLIWKKQCAMPQRSQLLMLAASVMIGYALPYALQPYLVGVFGSAYIGMMVSFVPLLTILVSIPMLRIYPNRWQTLGVCGGLCCISLIIEDGLQRLGDAPWWLLVIPLLVPASYAIANTLVKKYFETVPPIVLGTWCLCAASCVLLPLGYMTEDINWHTETDTTAGHPVLLAIGSVAILGMLGTGVVVAVFYYLIQQRGPLYAGMVAYVIPIGALIIGALDGETVSALQVTAIAGIISMVVLVQKNSQRL